RTVQRDILSCTLRAELTEQPESKVSYCPVENRVKLKRSSGSHPSKGESCEQVSLEVKNSSGVRMAVFWVDSEGREVRQMVLDPQQADVFVACRGHYLRARHSSSTSPSRWRLLSEMTVPMRHPRPTAPPTPIVDGNASGTSSDGYRWEVLACVGFPLPEAFSLKSYLGELGYLELSRGALGQRRTGRQETVLKQSTNIEGLVSVTLEEAFKGKNVTVTVQRRVPCPVCHGFGAASFVPCDRCGGSGKHVHDNTLSNYSTPAIISPEKCHRPDTGTTATDARVNDDGENCPSRDAFQENLSFYDCLCRKAWSEKGTGGEGGNDTGGLREGLGLKQTSDCAKCRGFGNVPAPRVDGEASYCALCAGSRFVEEEADLTLSIPIGVEKGHTEIYRGQGHIDIADLIEKLKPTGAGEETTTRDAARDEDSKTPNSTLSHRHPSPRTSSSAPSSSSPSVHASSDSSQSTLRVKRGDFRLTVDVLPHPLYSPEEGGADLHASISISLVEALTGFERDIAGLDGSIRTVRRRSRTFPGMLLRFPGLGMPVPSASPAEPKRPRARAASGQGSTPGSGATTPASPQTGLNLAGKASAVIEEVVVGNCGVRGGGAIEREPAFGDLVVKASVMLPSG
ncbi:unnamed protein product, partial [Hapterophycus canaliculatus]